MSLHDLNQVPLWLFTLLFAATILVALATGARLRRFVGTDPATVGSGQLIFGTVSILSLLIGFTFSLALNRHDQRRDVLLEESNAIRALDRTLVHLEQPLRGQISDALIVYARGRLLFVQSNLLIQQDMQDARATERDQLNRAVASAVPDSASGVSEAQLLAAVTRILDAGTRMEVVMLAHVPGRVVLMLVLLSLGSATIIGISIADRLSTLWLPAGVWALLLSLALSTIVDLDSPRWGSIQLDPRPMETAVRVAETE